MYPDGVERFCKAIGVDPSTELVFWYIAMQMEATTYTDLGGEFLEAEFTKGCQKNNADTLEKWVAVVPKLREKLNEKPIFKQVYKFAARYAVQPNKRNLEIDFALAI